MSEDFRDMSLVRTQVSRNAIGVLHYIFASWKKYCGFGKHAGMQEATWKFSHRPCQSLPDNPPSKKEKLNPMAYVMNQG